MGADAVSRRGRLDVELVRRGLARSRDQAARLIGSGRVSVRGHRAGKPATLVEAGAPIVVADGREVAYASRGGHKLAGALETFAAGGLAVSGRRCLDAGAAAGGFTDVLLRVGVARVIAVDVGYGQLAWSLRTDERVRVLERANVRTLRPEMIDGPVDLVVADLSFISLTLVLPALRDCARQDADHVLLVKPQFEVGRGLVGRGGVVREPDLRAAAVRRVAERAAALRLGVRGLTASTLPGPAGNVEYFLWLRAGASALEPADVERVVTAGPPSPRHDVRHGGGPRVGGDV